MKRILLTPHVERLAEDYLRDLKNLADSPIARLERLEYDFINVNLPSAYVDYIEAIINNYDDIITKKPNTFCLIDLIFARFNINLSQSNYSAPLTRKCQKSALIISKLVLGLFPNSC